MPATEDLGLFEDTTIAPSPPSPSSVKKKVLPADLKSKESTSEHAKSEATPSTTEGWIIVASVQTSRSVSGARFIPSSAIKQEQHPLTLDSKSIKDVKAHVEKKNHSDSTPSESTTKNSIANTTKAGSTASTESIIDKLDQVRRSVGWKKFHDLFVEIKNNFFDKRKF